MQLPFRFYTGIMLFTCFSLGIVSIAKAQSQGRKNSKPEKEISIYDWDTLKGKIPMNRIIFHDRVDKEQRRADVSDGSIDGMIYYSDDTVMTRILDNALFKAVDHLQVMIENMPAAPGDDKMLDNQTKIRYLTALSNLLKRFNADTKPDPVFYKKMVENFRQLVIARNEGRLLPFIKEKCHHLYVQQ
jgi:hypothetical protein